MDDHDVFAILTASDKRNKASSAFNLPQNAKWFRRATGGVADKPTLDSREPTPADEELSAKHVASAGNRLVLTFDELLKSSVFDGVHFGTNPRSCHVLLGHRGTGGVSGRQYSIVVDDNLRIWLHDYYSTHGTAVEYDGQCQKEVRKKEMWILSYKPGDPSQFDTVITHSGSLALRVEFPNHHDADPRYINNLENIAKIIQEAIPAVDGLGLDSAPTTATPSQVQTPGQRSIYYKVKRIGQGGFGEVHKVIRVRDGEYFAAKTFQPPANKRKRDEAITELLSMIRREFNMMKDNPHPNVIQVVEFQEKPEPLIVMDYYPLGNFVDAGIVDENVCVTALGQLLDGLDHLHKNAVAHRDLKPENILVTREPFLKFVISDFGLAKATTETTLLTTFCGTLKYLAPEVFPGFHDSYGPLVDVWSLGVIALESIYGIPTPPTAPAPRRMAKTVQADAWWEWIKTWSRQLLDKLEDEEEGQMVEILLGMINVLPEKRWGADRCLTRGFQNGLFQRRAADGLVVCTNNAAGASVPTQEEDEGAKTLTTALLPTQAHINPKATIV